MRWERGSTTSSPVRCGRGFLSALLACWMGFRLRYSSAHSTACVRRQTCCRLDALLCPSLACPCAVSEILNSLIKVYKQIFRVNTLTDGVLFSKYPQTALVLDEVLKEASLCGGGTGVGGDQTRSHSTRPRELSCIPRSPHVLPRAAAAGHRATPGQQLGGPSYGMQGAGGSVALGFCPCPGVHPASGAAGPCDAMVPAPALLAAQIPLNTPASEASGDKVKSFKGMIASVAGVSPGQKASPKPKA